MTKTWTYHRLNISVTNVNSNSEYQPLMAANNFMIMCQDNEKSINQDKWFVPKKWLPDSLHHKQNTDNIISPR